MKMAKPVVAYFDEYTVMTMTINVVVLREERIPTRCNNINDLLSITDIDY